MLQVGAIGAACHRTSTVKVLSGLFYLVVFYSLYLYFWFFNKVGIALALILLVAA